MKILQGMLCASLLLVAGNLMPAARSGMKQIINPEIVAAWKSGKDLKESTIAVAKKIKSYIDSAQFGKAKEAIDYLNLQGAKPAVALLTEKLKTAQAALAGKELPSGQGESKRSGAIIGAAIAPTITTPTVTPKKTPAGPTPSVEQLWGVSVPSESESKAVSAQPSQGFRERAKLLEIRILDNLERDELADDYLQEYHGLLAEMKGRESEDVVRELTQKFVKLANHNEKFKADRASKPLTKHEEIDVIKGRLQSLIAPIQDKLGRKIPVTDEIAQYRNLINELARTGATPEVLKPFEKTLSTLISAHEKIKTGSGGSPKYGTELLKFQILVNEINKLIGEERYAYVAYDKTKELRNLFEAFKIKFGTSVPATIIANWEAKINKLEADTSPDEL